MKIRIMNVGTDIVVGPDCDAPIPEAMRVVCRQVLAWGSALVKTRHGNWEVFVVRTGDSAIFAIRQAGNLLLEAVVVREGQGTLVWEDMIRRCQSHREAGQLTDFSKPLPPPPTPWLSIFSQKAFMQFPEPVKTELGELLLGLADTFIEGQSVETDCSMASRN
jgi:hypothetical protein